MLDESCFNFKFTIIYLEIEITDLIMIFTECKTYYRNRASMV